MGTSSLSLTADGHRSLREQAYDALEDLIIRGEIPSGRIVSEGEFTERLGLGRTPVHEAVQKLAQEGLILILPRKGLLVIEISITRQLQTLEIRRPLERLLASCAALRANEEQRAMMRDYARTTREIGETGDARQFLSIIKRNHGLLEKASGNDLMQSVMALVHARSRRFWFSYADANALRAASKLHASLLESVSAGDDAKALADADSLVDYLEEFCHSTIEGYGHNPDRPTFRARERNGADE